MANNGGFRETPMGYYRDRPSFTEAEIAPKMGKVGTVYLRATKDSQKVCRVARVEGGFQVNYPWGIFGEGENWEVYSTLKGALHHANAWLFSREVVVGDMFTEMINQGLRDCEVLAVKKIRYRIVFEMPKGDQQGWRRGVPICGRLFYGVSN